MSDAPGILDRLAQILVASRGGKDLGEGAVLTFIALLLHADSSRGRARPSIDAIAAMTGVHRRNVQRALDRLLACGAIESTEEDRTRRSSGGRGKITQFDVAPHAIRGDAATLCARERVANSPPLAIAKGGELATDTASNGGDPATVADGKGGDWRSKPWRLDHETVAPAPPEHSEHVEHVPPNPPRGAGNRSAAPETLKPETDEVDPARQRRRLEMFQTIQRLGRIEREFLVRGVVHDFEAAGGTLDDLGVLIAESDDGQRSRRDRIGLVTHWASEVGLWRAVLADVRHRARAAAQPLRQASSATSPASAGEVFALPARTRP